MSVLSDFDLIDIYNGKQEPQTQGAHIVALRAVADAAIAADRAARAEPKAVGKVDSSCDGGMYWFWGPQLEDGELLYTAPPAAPVVPEDISPANVPMYWRDESSNACAYAAGWNACRTTMLAAPAEPSGNSGEFAAPAGEQVGLTDAEVKEHFHHGSRTCKVSGPMNARDLSGIRQVISAHESKRASCSQTAKKSTHEVGRVDETGKSEHVGGAA